MNRLTIPSLTPLPIQGQFIVVKPFPGQQANLTIQGPIDE